MLIGKGGGFGEVYVAKASTLKKTLFKATLLPKDPTARNIALAGLGRADRKVNYDLALKCWKNNGCSTGTGGKLTVAYIEQFGENVYRQMSKMEFILQALTYPRRRQDHLLRAPTRTSPRRSPTSRRRSHRRSA